MPGPPARRRADQLTEPVSGCHRRHFQVLALDVDVVTDDGGVAAAMDFLAQRAGPPYPPQRHLGVAVTTDQGGYRVRVDGVEGGRQYTPEAVVEDVFTTVYLRALAMFASHCLIRGAIGSAGGRRFLLCGNRRSGVTTLALRLLYDGAPIESDALALIGADGVTAVARRFHLPAGTGALVPEIAGALDSLPRLRFGDEVLSAFDPSEAGFDWSTGTGAVDVVVWLDPNHGGQTRLAAMSHVEMIRRVMGRTSPPCGWGIVGRGADRRGRPGPVRPAGSRLAWTKLAAALLKVLEAGA